MKRMLLGFTIAALLSACVQRDYSVVDKYTLEVEPVTNPVKADPQAVELGQLLAKSMDGVSGTKVLRAGDNVLVSMESGAMFAVEKSEMADDVTTMLYPLVEAAKQYPEAAIRVEGFTDSSGPAEKNATLSLARAQQVANYFQQNDISEDRITVAGYGEKYPVADNETDEGKAANRRIVVTFSIPKIANE